MARPPLTVMPATGNAFRVQVERALDYVEALSPEVDLSGLVVDLSALQPLDAELTALAGLEAAADAVPYFTGPGAAALTGLSAFARSLLVASDAAAARATLDAAASGHTHDGTSSGNFTFDCGSPTVAGNFTLDCGAP